MPRMQWMLARKGTALKTYLSLQGSDLYYARLDFKKMMFEGIHFLKYFTKLLFKFKINFTNTMVCFLYVLN